MRLEAVGRTDPGKKRSNNEDSFYIDPQKGLFVLADGMGGHEGGEVASKLAVEGIRDFMETHDNLPLTPQGLTEAVKYANQSIYLRTVNSPGAGAMGSTVVAALIQHHHLVIAHVGDSRAYVLTSGGLRRLTDDHTIISQLIQQGHLKEEEALFHPKHGALLRALGMEPVVEIDTKEMTYDGGIFLLCSDGLTDMLRDREIEEILLSAADPETACQQLVSKANDKGGLDNITVIVVKAKDKGGGE